MTTFSPREIVSELDRFIIGQTDAKRAVAVALRNRWRRKQLPDDLREELKKIRQDGYAITRGEYVNDAVGIGAPVFNSEGELAGSIGIIAPEIRIDSPELLETQRDLVQFYASALSSDLGYEKHDVFQ